MKNKLLLLLALSIVFLAGCRDKHDPEPPTIDKIVGQYSGGNLKATIDGISAPEFPYRLFRKMTTPPLLSCLT